MRKLLYTLTLVLALPFFMTAQVYELAERSNPWNQGRNINGLRTDSTTVSYAEIFGGYEAGDFRRFSDALTTWKSGLIAESMLHLEKMSMKGLFTFEHQQGYEMCGSMLVKQDYYPVNVIEFTPGTKTKQTYGVEGGLTYDIAPQWRIGGQLNFTSVNYSKRKDLRHTTYLLDLDLCPSVLWHHGDFSVGLSYLLNKNTESVKAEQVGVSAEEFKVFLDKGVRSGKYEHWKGNGVHLKEPGVDGFPVKEISHGGAFQFSWKELYFDTEYRYSHGKIGEKDHIWFEFPGHSVKSFLNYRMYRPRGRHHLRLLFNYKLLENNEYNLVYENEGGVSIPKRYAANLIYNREEISILPEYEFVSKQWLLRWNIGYKQIKEISSQLFPYICTALQNNYHTFLEGKVHLWKFELGANVRFSITDITEKERVTTDVGQTEPPIRIKDYSDCWLLYESSPKIDFGLSVRYNFWKGLYAELSGNYLRAFPMVEKTILPEMCLHPERWSILLKLGYNF